MTETPILNRMTAQYYSYYDILYDDAAVHDRNHDYAYDYIKAKDYDGYDGGLKAFETASVSGVVWEDTNYNGIQDDGEAAYHNSKNPAVVHLQQYFYRSGEWVLENAAFRTHETKTDGTYTFSNLPTYVEKDGACRTRGTVHDVCSPVISFF